MSSALEDFGDLMGTDIVVTNPSTGVRSMFGVRGYSTAGSTFKAHVQEVNGTNRRLTGIDEFCSSIAWMANTSTGDVHRDSVFTFPDGTHPPAKVITYPRDENGDVHHTKIVFG